MTFKSLKKIDLRIKSKYLVSEVSIIPNFRIFIVVTVLLPTLSIL